jgi:hypothetical protein
MSSAKASPYRDLVKANDLVTKNFLSLNSFGVVTETKAGDVSFKSTISGDDKKPFAAVVEPKYEWKEQNLAFDGKLSSANAFTAKGTYKNLFTDGFNVSVQGDRTVVLDKKEDSDPVLKVTNSVTGGAQFNNELVHFTLDVKLPVQSEGKTTLSSALHGKPVDNVDVGVKVDWEAGGSPKVEGKLIGGTDKLEGAVSFFYPTKTWGFNFWHSCCSNFQWAATVSLPPSTASKDPEPVINVAGNYKFDDSTTLKAKVSAKVDRTNAKDHVYRAGLSLQQKVASNTTVTVGADVNLNNALSLGSGKRGSTVGDASSCGLQIAFK